MTDLVERLRRAADPFWFHTRDEVIAEAADEIERLRAALDVCADYGDKQVAEIKRLREALERYGDHEYECSMKDTWECSCGYTKELRMEAV